MAEWTRTNAFALNWRNVIQGMGTGLAVMVALAAGAAALLSRELIPLESINYIAAGILLISGFACAAGTGKGTVPDAATAAGCVWLALLLINMVFFDFALTGLITGILPIFGGTAVWILIEKELKFTGRRHRRKYRHR